MIKWPREHFSFLKIKKTTVCICLCVHVCACTCVCAHMCMCLHACMHAPYAYLKSPEEGIGSPGARVTSGIEVPHVGAEIVLILVPQPPKWWGLQLGAIMPGLFLILYGPAHMAPCVGNSPWCPHTRWNQPCSLDSTLYLYKTHGMLLTVGSVLPKGYRAWYAAGTP